MGRYRRVMAVGCTHGEFMHPALRKQVLEFKENFRPEIRFDLGDLIDTACFRSGASGTPDEARNPKDDEAMALRWLDEYEPNRITWGNHDWRLYESQRHPKAIVSALAGEMWGRLTAKAAKLRAKTVPYHVRHGWIYEAGMAWGHGFMINQQAVRDHAEMVGCPVVMAHLHTAQVVQGRTLKRSLSYCVGSLADEEKLTYGHRRRNSLTHSHGLVFGEMSESDARLWLVSSDNGRELSFPPGVAA